MLDILVDSHLGIYLPQTFALEDGERWGIKEEDLEILLAGPEHPEYWETWDSVLDYAELVNASGRLWRLVQRDDLFAYTGELPDDFYS